MLTKKDFLKDISHNFGIDYGEQKIEVNNKKKIIRKKNILDTITIPMFYRDILMLNDFIKVSSTSIFKLHKSYPSPRSIYPLSLSIIYNNYIYTKDPYNKNYMKYELFNKTKNGDEYIKIDFQDKYPAFYNSIKKTLLYLECGHLLYNIGLIGLKYNIPLNIFLNNNSIIIRSKTEIEKNKKVVLNDLQYKFKKRSSGPYNIEVYLGNTTYKKKPSLQMDKSKVISNLFFNNNYEKFISYDFFIKQDNMFRCNYTDKEISYKDLNEFYPFVNFKASQALVIFSINNLEEAYDNLTYLYLNIGMRAQEIILNNCDDRTFVRPIKSINLKNIEKILGVDCHRKTPVYGLIISNY